MRSNHRLLDGCNELQRPDLQETPRPSRSDRSRPRPGTREHVRAAELDLIVSVDVAQRLDFPALVAVAPQWPRQADEGPTYHVRAAARGQQNVPYPMMADEIEHLTQVPPFKGATLVVDGTGVGQGLVDELRSRGISLMAIWFTAGRHIGQSGGYVTVPKGLLVTTAKRVIQSDRIKFAEGACGNLIRELEDLEHTITEAGNHGYKAVEGGDDDLAFALCMALWIGERQQEIRQRRMARLLRDRSRRA